MDHGQNLFDMNLSLRLGIGSDHAGFELKESLLSFLKEKGITDANVLDAINTIPRHLFLDSSFEQFDRQLPVANDAHGEAYRK